MTRGFGGLGSGLLRWTSLRLRLVAVFENSGDLSGARARLAEFVRANPDDLGALRHLASLESRTGNVEGAIDTLARLVDVEQGDSLIQTALRYSEACELAGRLPECRAALESRMKEDCPVAARPQPVANRPALCSACATPARAYRNRADLRGVR